MPRKRSKKYGRNLDSEEDLVLPFGHHDEKFSEIVEHSLNEKNQADLLKEKKGTAARDHEPSLGQRLQAYPGPEAELDLHGLTADQAETRIEAFVRNSRARGLRTLRLITGKGRHSPGGKAVLPRVAEGTVRLLKKEKIVVAHRWEGKSDHGSMLVFLVF